MMGASEKKAMEIRRRNREIHQQIIDDKGGTWLKEMGDGTMASFTTITDAVSAAVEIRQTCKQVLDIELKVGIHLGEVIYEDNDVFGDGVNIASRIEALAVGGGILISDPVFKEISNKEDFDTAFLGETSLKNVKEPVKVYQVLDGDLVKPTIKIKKKSKLNKILVTFFLVLLVAGYFTYNLLTEKSIYTNPSIAVLAFSDQSPNGDQEWLGDGIADEILNVLAQVKELKVSGRTSSFSFKDKDATIKEIGETLNVKTVLEGSVSKVGDKLRITAQLIDVETEAHLWSKKFDSDAEDIFAIVDEVAQLIAGSLTSMLSVEEIENIKMAYKPKPGAYEYFLKAENLHNEFAEEGFTTISARNYNMDDFKRAQELYLKAIEIDPKFVDALAGLAKLHDTRGDIEGISEHGLFANRSPSSYKKPDSILRVAIQIDPNSPYLLYLLGFVNPNLDSVFFFLNKAYKLDPYNHGNRLLVDKLYRLGFYDLSLKFCRKFLANDPLNKPLQTILGGILFFSGQIEECKMEANKLLDLDKDDFQANNMLFIVAIAADRDVDEATRMSNRLFQISPDSTAHRRRQALIYAIQGKKEEALNEWDGLPVLFALEMIDRILSTSELVSKNQPIPYLGRFGYLHNVNNPWWTDKMRQHPVFPQYLKEAKIVHEERVKKYYHIFDD